MYYCSTVKSAFVGLFYAVYQGMYVQVRNMNIPLCAGKRIQVGILYYVIQAVSLSLINIKLFKNTSKVFTWQERLRTSSSQENACPWLRKMIFKHAHYDNFCMSKISKWNI